MYMMTGKIALYSKARSSVAQEGAIFGDAFTNILDTRAHLCVSISRCALSKCVFSRWQVHDFLSVLWSKSQ